MTWQNPILLIKKSNISLAISFLGGGLEVGGWGGGEGVVGRMLDGLFKCFDSINSWIGLMSLSKMEIYELIFLT